MRILQWNILDPAVAQNDDWNSRRERIVNEIIAIIEKARPDIISLVEVPKNYNGEAHGGLDRLLAEKLRANHKAVGDNNSDSDSIYRYKFLNTFQRTVNPTYLPPRNNDDVDFEEPSNDEYNDYDNEGNYGELFSKPQTPPRVKPITPTGGKSRYAMLLLYRHNLRYQYTFAINFCMTVDTAICDAYGIAMVIDNAMYTAVHLQVNKDRALTADAESQSRLMQLKVITSIRPNLDNIIFGDLKSDSTLDEQLVSKGESVESLTSDSIPAISYTSIGPENSYVGTSKVGHPMLLPQECTMISCKSDDRTKLLYDRMIYPKYKYDALVYNLNSADDTDYIMRFQNKILSDHLPMVYDIVKKPVVSEAS